MKAGTTAVRLGMSLAAVAVTNSVSHAQIETPAPIGVNRVLAEFHHQFDQPRLVEIRHGVHVAFGYGMSNFTFIETDHGLIVVDAGWFAHEMERALVDLRKITSKPVLAVIYTHSHSDHTGGAGALGDRKELPIYAPEGFGTDEWAESRRQFTPQLVRAYSQLGLMLEQAGENPVGGGVGRAPRIGLRHYAAPNRFVSKPETLTIDGLEIRLIPAAMDVRDGLMVWLPSKKVLLAGDTVTGVFTILETPRYVPTRTPVLMARSFDNALALRPDVVVPGHGRLLQNPADVEAVLTANRDLSYFLIDQVDRRIERGEGVEKIVHEIALPDALARNPDLQPYYHRKEWIIRSLVAKRLGWYTELFDLVRPDGVDGARKVVALVGADRLVGGFDEATVRQDYRWAAQIAHWLQSARGTEADRQRWRQALTAIAAQTDSVNERSYILSELAAQSGRIDWSSAAREPHLAFARSLPSHELVDLLRMRIDPEAAKGKQAKVRLVIEDTGETFDLLLKNGALMFAGASDPAPAITLRKTREQLAAMFADGAAWAELYQ